MSYNCVGSTLYNDILLEIYPDCSGLIIHNISNHIGDNELFVLLNSILDKYSLSHHGVIIYYNGACRLTIEKRCLELKKLIPFLKSLESDHIQAVS